MNTTNYNRTGNPMADTTITSLFSLIVAIFAVGGVFGGLAAGWWADFFGRYHVHTINYKLSKKYKSRKASF